jgi:hypothetical protein
MLLIWGGFCAVAWGANRIANGCIPLRTVAWPQGGTITDPCSGTTTTSKPATAPVPKVNAQGRALTKTGSLATNPKNAINPAPHPGR